MSYNPTAIVPPVPLNQITNPGPNELIGDTDGGTTTGAVVVGSGLTFASGLLTADLGNSQVNPVIKNSDYTMGQTDSGVEADASGGPFTVTLPFSPVAGFRYFVKKIDSSTNAVTVVGSSGTIDGLASIDITGTNDSLSLIFNTVNWAIEADNTVADFEIGANPTRTLNTPITNGSYRRRVSVSIDLNSTITAKAYAGYITTAGGSALTQPDVVGAPAGAAFAVTPRFSYSFEVDPGASYQITSDVGVGGTATLVSVLEVDL